MESRYIAVLVDIKRGWLRKPLVAAYASLVMAPVWSIGIVVAVCVGMAEAVWNNGRMVVEETRSVWRSVANTWHGRK